MRLITLVGLAVALVVAGCGDSAKDKPAAAKTTIPRGAAYVGDWHALLTKRQLQDRGDERMAGTFRLSLNPDGTYKMYQELDGESYGRYRPAGKNRLLFGYDHGCTAGGYRGTAVYSWTVTDGKLRLHAETPETGGCTGRTETLILPAWERR